MLPITDLWFRFGGTLEQLAEGLGLEGVSFDAENYWEWVIGSFRGVELDVTRTHTLAPLETDTRIFRLDRAPFENEPIEELAGRLLRLGVASVKCGQWIYRSGQEFDLIVVEERT